MAIRSEQIIKLDTERFERFGSTYTVELERAVREHPDEYVWPVEEVPTVAARMLDAIQHKSFNKDSRAIKSTCKAFGIKHTYQAIYAWLEGEER